MSFAAPEVAALYGTMDSTAIDDEKPFGSHVLRSMAISNNRLMSKGQPLFAYVVPETDTAEQGTSAYAMTASPRWSRILSGLFVPKKPGLVEAQVRIRAKIPNTITVHLQVVAHKWRNLDPRTPDNSRNTVAMVGDGSFADYELDEVQIEPGPFEDFSVWIHAEPGLAKATGYGTGPYNNTLTTGHPYRADLLASGASFSSANNLADGATELRFEDASGNPTSGHIIIGNTTGGDITFYPPLTPEQMSLAQTAGNWAIYQHTTFDLSAIVCAAVARTL